VTTCRMEDGVRMICGPHRIGVNRVNKKIKEGDGFGMDGGDGAG
jgi:hypothetical protein